MYKNCLRLTHSTYDIAVFITTYIAINPYSAGIDFRRQNRTSVECTPYVLIIIILLHIYIFLHISATSTNIEKNQDSPISKV